MKPLYIWIGVLVSLVGYWALMNLLF